MAKYYDIYYQYHVWLFFFLIGYTIAKHLLLVGDFNPSEKYDFVSWDDKIPNWMEQFTSHVPVTSHQILNHHTLRDHQGLPKAARAPPCRRPVPAPHGLADRPTSGCQRNQWSPGGKAPSRRLYWVYTSCSHTHTQIYIYICVCLNVCM